MQPEILLAASIRRKQNGASPCGAQKGWKDLKKTRISVAVAVATVLAASACTSDGSGKTEAKSSTSTSASAPASPTTGSTTPSASSSPSAPASAPATSPSAVPSSPAPSTSASKSPTSAKPSASSAKPSTSSAKPTTSSAKPSTSKPPAKPPVTNAKFDSRCMTGRAMCIDKTTRKLTWIIDGVPQFSVEVRFGSKELPTREGAFSVFLKSKDHVSNIYHTPMPYAMFFSGGQAVHYSPDFAKNGYNGASHGCANVRNLPLIKRLFNESRIGDKVIVYRS